MKCDQCKYWWQIALEDSTDVLKSGVFDCGAHVDVGVVVGEHVLQAVILGLVLLVDGDEAEEYGTAPCTGDKDQSNGCCAPVECGVLEHFVLTLTLQRSVVGHWFWLLGLHHSGNGVLYDLIGVVRNGAKRVDVGREQVQEVALGDCGSDRRRGARPGLIGRARRRLWLTVQLPVLAAKTRAARVFSARVEIVAIDGLANALAHNTEAVS